MGESFEQKKSEIQRQVAERREHVRQQEERKTRTEARRRREEAKKRAEVVLVQPGAAYVSILLARRMATQVSNVVQRLEPFDIESREVDGYKVFDGRELAAAFAGGALGRANMHALKIAEVVSPGDLAEDPDLDSDMVTAQLRAGAGASFMDMRYGAPQPNTAIDPAGKPFRSVLERLFRKATDSLRHRKLTGRALGLVAWAAEGGDPDNGPAERLEYTFPLEIGWRGDTQVDDAGYPAIWIRHAPELQD